MISVAERTEDSSVATDVICTCDPIGIVCGFRIPDAKVNSWYCPSEVRTVTVLRDDDTTVPVNFVSS